MKYKQKKFLLDCLEYLEEAINGYEKGLFIENCLGHVFEHGAVTTSDYQALAPSSVEKDVRTYGNWLDSFVTLLNVHKNDLWALNTHGLSKFPMLKKIKGGGAGNKSRFEVMPEVMKDDLSTEPLPLNTSSSVHFAPNITASHEVDFEAIKYRKVKLKKTPWYLIAGQKAFDKPKRRQFLVGILLLYYVTSFLLLSYIIAVNYGKPMTDTWWVFVLMIFYFLLHGPVRNTLSICVSKIALLNDFFQPVGATCISEPLTTSELKRLEELPRKLHSVLIEADCPICNVKYGLEGSVSLTRAGIFNRKIIGKCYNNPREHNFTFDKDLMSGRFKK